MIAILEKICASVAQRVEAQKEQLSLTEMSQAEMRSPCDFEALFERGGLNVIAEVKLASPSEGEIAQLDPVAVATEYLTNGATALSVLTEQDHFSGSPENLTRIREAHPSAPLLMKDFVIDPYQIAWARHLGADCVLLIVACLGRDRTREFLEIARQWEMNCLVEVHDAEELAIALDLGATLIGVNNRNLKTMEVSLQTSRDLRRSIPPEVTSISESGLRTHQDLVELQRLGYQGFLIGTSFMKTGAPGKALRKILEGSDEC